MIKGLSVDQTRPLPAAKPQQKTERAKESGFAEQLIGAKSERPENLNRNERKNSGRDDSNREGSRSVEREKDSKSSTDLRASRDDVRKNAKRTDVKSERDERDERESDRDDDRASARSQSQGVPPQNPSPAHIPNSRRPASSDEAPIVIENPKGSDSQELKLPDFFSKSALEKGSKVAAGAASGSGEAGETADLLSSMNDGEALTREEAMEQFVTRMQDELGVPPEKLLQAFAQLDDKALQAPPEESMGQLMGALELAPQQEARATELYQDLLKTTGDSRLQERVAGMDQGVSFDVLSPRDAALRKLNSSLDDLNKSFFRKGGAAAEPKKAQSAVESMDIELAKLMRTKSDARDVSDQSQNGLAATAMRPDAFEADTVSASSASAGDSSALAALLAANGLSPSALSAEGDGQGGAMGGEAGGGAGGSSARGLSPTKSALQSAFAKEMSQELKEEDTDLGDVDTASEAGGGNVDFATDGSQLVDSAKPVAGGARAAAMGPADMMMNRQATSKDEQDNVRELIKQAQVMIKRGGGEMKMEMKPEGMGAIQLRVNVENGNVNVQMLTESESAKHVLEKGLSELKSNLAAHELKVQSLSVDVGNDVKNQMDQQGTQDQARQQARQFASDFMGSFRDERQGFRQGVFENRGWRSYGRNTNPEGIQPETAARVAAKSRDANGESKRLNLVA